MERPQGYALITGASSGLGEEYAYQLARRSWPLILVARSSDGLERVRATILNTHPGLDVRCIPMDLSQAGAPTALFHQTQAAGLFVSLLINNAGFGAFGEFAKQHRERMRQMIDLNVAALVELAHLYLAPMRQRRHGGILNIASVAGFLPLPYSAVYAATKAFVLSFSDALSEEARPYGVRVLAVNPGPTSTNFFRVAGESPYNHPLRSQSSAEVVAESLRAFDRRRRSVVTGATNRLLVGITRWVPRTWILRIMGQRIRQGMQN